MWITKIKDSLLRREGVQKSIINAVNAPIVGDLYDKIYFSLIRKKIENSPGILTIEPSNLCNLRCLMCPYQKMKRKKESVKMKDYKRIIDQAKELGFEILCLQQYNEPFLDKEIFERISYARKKGMKIWIVSNGTLLNKEMRKKILDNPPDLIRISFDGSKKETYEQIRRGAKFEIVRENILNLFKERNERKQRCPIIEVYFTIMGINKKEIKDFLDFWKSKCDSASIYPADSRQSEVFVGMKYKNLKPYPCFNPKNLYILSNLTVVPCCVDYDGEVILGDLKKQSLKEIVSSKKFKMMAESHIKRGCKIPMCTKCSKLYIDSAFIWWSF